MLFAGTGRHRRRTQTEKAIAVAGVAGVGLALPLLTATGAHAASASTWDKVADCESTGNWSINTGNGFYGGLQFTSSTWKAYGGTQYAAQANQATRAQQISVAEQVLASQGPGAWPVCSVKAGLTSGGAPASVDTGSSDADAAAKPSAPGKPSKQGKPAKPQAQSQSQQQSATPGFPGRVGWDPAGHVYWYQNNGGWYWTSHQSVYNQYAAHTAPAAPVGPAAAPAAATTGGQAYTVRTGDTLSTIAQAQHVAGGWRSVYDGNHATVGGNPDLILPGQVLHFG
ncbi:LysM peptidoglycan-binding domain-containing protein [Kitasatospora mediocidica]|uniref:LysM peptidoglycan-binding domain-containing protein n=1 Tax=Kitasatospora mediocidica TaxID=58352 RepID=UPI000564F410|nr:transglycosylase family protein [Kitasatospora mediocidica]